MITHLKGKLVEKNLTHVVVECGGIGYFVHISLHTYSLIEDAENIFIYTHLQVREDAQTLYGFMEKVERDVFLKLISVSGIGASTARAMLSSLPPIQVMEAIVSEDVETIKSVKGIGAKTAQRVIIDLKDKMNDLVEFKEVHVQHATHKNEALAALETLGYTRKQSEKVVQKIVSEDADLSVALIIKQALKKL